MGMWPVGWPGLGDGAFPWEASGSHLSQASFLRTPTWRPSARRSWPRSSNRTSASRRRWGRPFVDRNWGVRARGLVLPDLGLQHRPRPRRRPECEPVAASPLGGLQRILVNTLNMSVRLENGAGWVQGCGSLVIRASLCCPVGMTAVALPHIPGVQGSSGQQQVPAISCACTAT